MKTEWENSIEETRILELETRIGTVETDLETLKILFGEIQMLIMKLAENQQILSRKYGSWSYVILNDDKES